MFNYDFKDKEIFSRSRGLPLYTSQTLGRLWDRGYSTIGDVSEASAMYQSQYTQKDFKHGNLTNKRKSHSKHAGIGGRYFLQHYKQILTLGFVPMNGRKMPLPRYFEKLAHKHYCHFYEPSFFRDSTERKAWYRPFKNGLENKEIADLYKEYLKNKELRLSELVSEWEEVISQYMESDEPPDFQKSGENALYDLKNKNTLERF